METLAYRAAKNGLVPLDLPAFCIGVYHEESLKDKNPKLVFVLIMKKKGEESTFISRARAESELRIERTDITFTSFYGVGFCTGGVAEDYEVVVLDKADDGGLSLNQEFTTRGAGGRSLHKAEHIISELLECDVTDYRRKQAAATTKTQDPSPVSETVQDADRASRPKKK